MQFVKFPDRVAHGVTHGKAVVVVVLDKVSTVEWCTDQVSAVIHMVDGTSYRVAMGLDDVVTALLQAARRANPGEMDAQVYIDSLSKSDSF